MLTAPSPLHDPVQANTLATAQTTDQPAQGVALVASLVALGVLLHAVETLVLPAVLPLRLGLANVVLVVAVVRYGARLALGVALGRVLVSSVLWGYLLQPVFWFSLAGALAAWAVMTVLHRGLPGALSVLGLSWAGAAAHLAGQCVVLVLLVPVAVSLLLPWLLLLALAGGAVVGLVAAATLRQLGAGGTA